MTDRSYRISWITFALALASVALIPATLFLIDDGHPGWDQLPDQLTILFGGYLIAVSFLTVSFVSGLYTWRRRKIALLWVVPSGLVVLSTGAYLIVLLVGSLVGPYWKAHAVEPSKTGPLKRGVRQRDLMSCEPYHEAESISVHV